MNQTTEASNRSTCKAYLKDHFPNGFVGGEMRFKVILRWTFSWWYGMPPERSDFVLEPGKEYLIIEWNDKGILTNHSGLTNDMCVPFDFIKSIGPIKR